MDKLDDVSFDSGCDSVDIEENVDIIEIQFGFKNKRVIDLLEERGDYIGKHKFDKVAKVEKKL